MSYNNVAEQWTTEPQKLNRLFIDVAEETHPDREIRLSDLTGGVPCIAHYAARTQGEILRALAQKMARASWSGDRLKRVRGGVYVWDCRQREAA